jgi:hypothetical protein
MKKHGYATLQGNEYFAFWYKKIAAEIAGVKIRPEDWIQRAHTIFAGAGTSTVHISLYTDWRVSNLGDGNNHTQPFPASHSGGPR